MTCHGPWCLTLLMTVLGGVVLSVPDGAIWRLHQLTRDRSDPMVRPAVDHANTVEVVLELALHTIIALESTAQTLHSDIWLRLTWFNPQIAWQPEEFDGIRLLHVSAFDVWVPDIVVYNAISKSESLDDLRKNFPVSVESTGVMHWNYSLVVQTTCSLDMTYFPVDTQDCFLELAPWTYSGLEVHVLNGSSVVDLGSFAENGEYTLQSTKVVSTTDIYTCCPNEPYYGLKFHLILQRLPGFYFFNIGLPTMLMLLLACASVILPAESESKLTLGVTIFLSQVFMVMVVTEYTPVQSLSTPFLTKYMLNLLMIMTLYILVGVGIVRMHTHARSAVHVPAPLRVAFLNPAMLRLFFPIRWRQHRNRLRKQANPKEPRAGTLPQYNGGFVADGPVLWHGIPLGQQRHAATQTEPPSQAALSEHAACHKEGGWDLLCLSEWALMALICERFWNMMLLGFTLIGLIWNIMLIYCGAQCPDAVLNPWPW